MKQNLPQAAPADSPVVKQRTARGIVVNAPKKNAPPCDGASGKENLTFSALAHSLGRNGKVIGDCFILVIIWSRIQCGRLDVLPVGYTIL